MGGAKRRVVGGQDGQECPERPAGQPDCRVTWLARRAGLGVRSQEGRRQACFGTASEMAIPRVVESRQVETYCRQHGQETWLGDGGSAGLEVGVPSRSAGFDDPAGKFGLSQTRI